MKKLIIAMLAFCCCMIVPVATYAQASPNSSDNGNGRKDYMLMQKREGDVSENGQSVPITVEWTLKDGTKVMPDGTVTNKDGKKWALKEGDRVTMQGTAKKASASQAKTQ